MKIWPPVVALLLPLLTYGAPQTWTIGNNQIERTLAFDDGSGLFTQGLKDLATHADFIVPGKLRLSVAPEFSFQCNGHTYRGASSDFALVSAGETPLQNGRSLTIRLHAKQIPLEVSVVYDVYDGYPAIRKNLVLRNAGSEILHISHLNVEAIAPSVGPENETILNTQYGTIPREIFYTGRSEDAGLLVSNGRTGIGFAILSEVPGYMKRTEVAGWADPERIPIGVLYDTDLMPFERSIQPGQEFKTARASLVTFRNGDGFHDPHWVLPSYTSHILMRRPNEKGVPWIYNTWEPFVRHINRDIVLQLIDTASEMGLDIFTIDDGWQQEYGENKVNLASFPGGLKSIQERIESKGMRLGLWIPLATIGANTPVARQHPEWAALDQDGKQKITSTAAGPKVVMCLASPYRDVAADRVNQAIDEFHLAYVKLDLTTIFNAYGEAPGCWAKGHYHGSWAESLNMIYESIAYVTGKIYEKHPGVLLDLTFELWGQKHIIDAGLLAAGDLDWMSNVDDNHPDSAGPLQARTLLYQRSASMPVESMLIGNIHAEMPSIAERFATEIGSAPLFLGDLRKLTPSGRQWYHDKIAWYKKLRAAYNLSESFFPLGNWMQPSPGKWDGFARMDHVGNGLIALFRNGANLSEVNIQLPLIPNGRFKARSVIANSDLGTFSKEEWNRGIPVPFSNFSSVQILEVTAAN